MGKKILINIHWFPSCTYFKIPTWHHLIQSWEDTHNNHPHYVGFPPCSMIDVNSLETTDSCEISRRWWVLSTYYFFGGFPGGSDGTESAWNARDPGSIPGSKDPLRKEWLPTLVFLPGEFYGQRSLVGYSPWGHEESDMTEQLIYSTHTIF